MNIFSKTPRANFANASETVVLCFANGADVRDDGWAQLAPFGDFPGRAVLQVSGQPKSFPAVQRLDRQSAELMVAHFKSPLNRVKRFFKGCPIYLGHPDHPGVSAQYPDKAPKGSIVDLAVREDGLYCLPSFFPEAAELVEQQKLYFSGRWSSEFVNEEGGQKVFRPDALISAGLTEHPNLPVEWLNTASITNPQPEPEMKLTTLIAALVPCGITLSADATEEQALAALQTLTRPTETTTTIANEKSVLESQLAAARTAFANERRAHIDRLLHHALMRGQITEAEKPVWKNRLEVEAQFINEAEALVQLPPRLKTTPREISVGARKVSIANAADRQALVRELVSNLMKERNLDYDEAYAAVEKANPTLFEAMKQPETKV